MASQHRLLNSWEYHKTPEAVCLDSTGLQKVTDLVKTLPTTSMMVVVGNKITFKYGDISEASYLASVRKSILGLIYGTYVKENKIDLHATMSDPGIDDVAGLLPVEKLCMLKTC